MRATYAVVGVLDRLGDIRNTVTLDDLVATGDSYELFLFNAGRLGSTNFELVVQGEEQITEKIRLGRLKRKAAHK